MSNPLPQEDTELATASVEHRASLPADALLSTIVVCGGRNFSDRDFVYRVLAILFIRHRFSTLIHGGARGADGLAGEWGESMCESVHVVRMPADWKKHGKGAGSIRNAAMLAQNPDAVIAFPGGPGTQNCCRQAEALGIPVLHFRPPPFEVPE